MFIFPGTFFLIVRFAWIVFDIHECVLDRGWRLFFLLAVLQALSFFVPTA